MALQRACRLRFRWKISASRGAAADVAREKRLTKWAHPPASAGNKTCAARQYRHEVHIGLLMPDNLSNGGWNGSTFIAARPLWQRGARSPRN